MVRKEPDLSNVAKRLTNKRQQCADEIRALMECMAVRFSLLRCAGRDTVGRPLQTPHARRTLLRTRPERDTCAPVSPSLWSSTTTARARGLEAARCDSPRSPPLRRRRGAIGRRHFSAHVPTPPIPTLLPNPTHRKAAWSSRTRHASSSAPRPCCACKTRYVPNALVGRLSAASPSAPLLALLTHSPPSLATYDPPNTQAKTDATRAQLSYRIQRIVSLFKRHGFR
jgi:hypothetical protein